MAGRDALDEARYLRNLRELWERNWPRHLPKEPHYPLGETTLTEYLRERARRTPEAPVLIYYGTQLSFRQLDEWSGRFAAYLQRSGLTKGDRVAVFLPNCPQFHIAFYGILRAGCVHVPVNPMFKAAELAYQLKDSGARLVLTLDHLVPLVQRVQGDTDVEHVLTTRYADFLPAEPAVPVHPSLWDCGERPSGVPDLMEVLAQAPAESMPDVAGLDDIAALNYTGGTTGLPKGCVHTQRDMLYTAACAASFTLDSRSEDVGLVYIPIFWIAGENTGLIQPVFSGHPVVLLSRWDVEAVLAAIERYRVTNFVGVMDHLVELMEHPRATATDLSSVRVVLAMSFIKKLNVEYRRQWQRLVGPHSMMREGAYGMTETHTVDTNTNGFQQDDMDLRSEPVFVGLPMPGTEVKIVDFDTRALVPLGEAGEIAIRTPSLLKSYWNKPEETARALVDGWLYTGDIGRIDEDGYLHFLGRRKEMLKVNGVSVFPTEIEVLLGAHPAVQSCAVVGRPDADKGEVPVAFVQLHPAYQDRVTAQDIHAWCRENMSVHKVPEVIVVDAMPLTATGKVKKEELRKRLSS